MRDLLLNAAERATRYTEAIGSRSVAPRAEDVARTDDKQSGYARWQTGKGFRRACGEGRRVASRD